MLLPFQGANPNIHSPRALPWAGCLLAFQAVTSQKLYRTAIIVDMFAGKQVYRGFVLMCCSQKRFMRRTNKKAPLKTNVIFGGDVIIYMS